MTDFVSLLFNAKIPIDCLYSRMLALLHSTIDRGEHEKYLFLPPYGNTENQLVTARTSRIE